MIQTIGAATSPYSPTHLAIGGFLVCFAGGMVLPARIARRLRTKWARQARIPVGRAALREARFDAVVGWIITALVLVIAGLTVVLVPLWQALLREAYLALHAAFVWSDLPLALLHGLVAMAVSVWPAIFLGLAVFCVNRLGGENRSIWMMLLVGASGGAMLVWIASRCAPARFDSRMIQMAAALPALLSAMLGGLAAAEPNRELIPSPGVRLPRLVKRYDKDRAGVLHAIGILLATLNLTALADHATVCASIFLMAYAASISVSEQSSAAFAQLQSQPHRILLFALITATVAMAAKVPSATWCVALSLALVGLFTGWITRQASIWENFSPRSTVGIVRMSRLAMAGAAIVALTPIALSIAPATTWGWCFSVVMIAAAAVMSRGAAVVRGPRTTGDEATMPSGRSLLRQGSAS